jgi:hypothetical protein
MTKSVILAISVLICTATTARAQIVGCGDVRTTNDIYQIDSRKAVALQANTTRSISPCPMVVQTEAWVVGVGGASKNKGAYSAPIYFQIGVPEWGTRHSESKHFIVWCCERYELFTYGHDEVNVIAPPEPDCSVFNGGGVYYVWSDSAQTCVEWVGSPIIVDPARDGFKLTSAEDGVLFDLTGDGIPEQVAWTEAGSDDAWLAMDRNGNGRIDNGGELFGNHTMAMAGVKALNGFEALKFLDQGIWAQIDNSFASFGQLVLWNDANHNGISDPGELTPVADSISVIETDYKEKQKHDRYGNEFRQKGSLRWRDGERGIVYDVWLRSVQ